MTKLKRIGLSAFALKMIMALLMLGDHLVFFLPMYFADIPVLAAIREFGRPVLTPFPLQLREFGRLVLPTFAYLMTVSLSYTRDRLRFFLRMAIAGLIMLAGNWILSLALGGPEINNGIFLSLAVSAGLIIAIERIIKNEGYAILNALAAALLIYAGTFVEGGLITPVMALVFYFLRGQRLAMCIVYIGVSWAYLEMADFMDIQIFQLWAIVPILLYNGQKGGSGGAFDKWFFYVFYPLHVWWLYVIRHLLFFT